MDRRKFLATSLVSAVAAGALPANARESQDAAKQGARECYELRRYHILTQQRKLADDYFRNALVPGLNRLGISPVGVFSVSIGPEGPSMYVLMPGASADALVTADARMSQDAEYRKAAADFLNAPAKAPAFVRMESSLMSALDAFPKLTVPGATAQHAPRMFELRTYESSTDQDHRVKVEQVNEGEIPIFLKAGFWPVFFGDTVIGGQLPNLTYMIGFANLAERDKCWDAFRSAPETRSLFSQPKYTFEDLVSNINNTILAPTPYSQI
ncbi:MAG TPA: NIPSNAP family protein [Candidatus Acidoferrales bacterium]|nr:NIPSNAP family protein [Candidatus Acidoferrales bacterium]